MKTALDYRIARRYLRQRHGGVVSRITRISIAGMALGTAAMIIVLSVYNGFDSLIRKQIAENTADFAVEPLEGKSFTADDDFVEALRSLEGVERVERTVSEVAAVSYEGRQAVVRLKGSESAFQCSVSAALAHELGIRTAFLSPLRIFYPSRSRAFSIANAQASLKSISQRPKAVIAGDENLVVIPLEDARGLLELDSLSVSRLEIYGGKIDRKDLETLCTAQLRVLDRYQQNSSLLKMMNSEKTAIFLILFFIVVLISFNVFGAQRILLTQKVEDIGTLRALGATSGRIRRIFFLEGWGISLTGLLIGLVVGIGVVLLQQTTGLVKMPGNFITTAYPVLLQWQDIVSCAVLVSGLGAVIAAIK